ncbi:allantoate amidohydrolase [Nonomuraea sp. C10]|uniref:allantoate amidohydrolase n=1 Tax=Nonomuraea sp. C10 TaxID=2600577 RepID=UPI0011CE6C1A|nr:allantoate amidohydrolase [Nonomuraea sp. C10]TXK43029.1 allantoate amidohydrolase [Nonomuraea sp. C10]
MLDALAHVGRDPATGGYVRDAWSDADLELRGWFAGESARRGLDLNEDRNGNLWAWWGDPSGEPGVVAGSHLDSVRQGGAYDGPLGVVSAFAALDLLRERGFRPGRPVGVACFTDEEGARFGVPCVGSRLLTGVLAPERALGLTDDRGDTLADVLIRAGRDPRGLGPDPETLATVGAFVELHVEQGRALAALDRPVGAGLSIWPHGRWRFDLRGRADHAGTTRLTDRDDPMLLLARLVLSARSAAARHEALATVGKVLVTPNNANAIPGHVAAWLDARGPTEASVRALVRDLYDQLTDDTPTGTNSGGRIEGPWGEIAGEGEIRPGRGLNPSGSGGFSEGSASSRANMTFPEGGGGLSGGADPSGNGGFRGGSASPRASASFPGGGEVSTGEGANLSGAGEVSAGGGANPSGGGEGSPGRGGSSSGGRVVEVREESWTPLVEFERGLRERVARAAGEVPVLATGAGHDAGILAAAGVPAAMLFVRNPTGVSHSPEEHAEEADCRAGVIALADVLEELCR